MKAALRFVTRQMVRFTRAIACDTYGDTASLSAGPCRRCVGDSVVGQFPLIDEHPGVPTNADGSAMNAEEIARAREIASAAV